jgi:hypothetical protein
MDLDTPSPPRTPSSDQAKSKTHDKAAKGDKDEVKERMQKPHKLLVIKEEWILLIGTTYGNFFNKKKFPENVQSWPMVNHHIQARGNAPLCMRYQSTSLCK